MAVIVLALVLTVAMTYLLAGKREVIAADTRDYLAFSPLRVFGYPAFLILMSSIADVRISAVVVQTLIFLGSSVFLSLVVLKATRSLVLTLVLVVLLYGNIVTTIYNYIAVTESLVTSSAMVALGALIQFYRTRRAIVVRPDLRHGGAQHRDQAGRSGLSAVPDRDRALLMGWRFASAP